MKRVLFFVPLMLAAAPAAAQNAAQADTGRVYELAEVESLPRPANAAELVAALQAGYPAELRAAGAEGTVQVSMVVGADGTVAQPSVVRSTNAAFDSATMAAVGLLRFEPARVGGRPVRARVELPIQWRLAAPAPAAAPVAAADTAAGDTASGYALEAVEEAPRPANLSAFQRALQASYPPALRAAGVTGVVMVRFRVTPEGVTEHIRVMQSSRPEFVQPTIASVRELRFRPARVSGRPVYVWVELPIHWETSREQGNPANLSPPPAGQAREDRRP